MHISVSRHRPAESADLISISHSNRTCPAVTAVLSISPIPTTKMALSARPSDNEFMSDSEIVPLRGWQVKELMQTIRTLQFENKQLVEKQSEWDTTREMFDMGRTHLKTKLYIAHSRIATLEKRLKEVDSAFESPTEALIRGEWKRGCWFSTPVTRAFLHEAESLFESKRHQGALAVLDKFLADIIPSIHRVEAKLFKAVILRDVNMLPQALRQCEEAIDTCSKYTDDPDVDLVWAKAHLYLGMFLFELGRHGVASIAFSCAACNPVIEEQADVWLRITSERIRLNGSGAIEEDVNATEECGSPSDSDDFDVSRAPSSPVSPSFKYSATTFFQNNSNRPLASQNTLKDAPRIFQSLDSYSIGADSAESDIPPKSGSAQVDNINPQTHRSSLSRADSATGSPKGIEGDSLTAQPPKSLSPPILRMGGRRSIMKSLYLSGNADPPAS